MTILKFQKTILEWYAKNGRHDLPWRPPILKLRRDGTYDPYKILVSEVMLQQTQVERVVGYYREFLKCFPTVQKLATSSPAEVLRAWKGLGYNRRALNLKRAAQIIVRDFRRRFPRDVAHIEKLPGVGHYTARAVLVFAFNTPEVFIETNIRRVFIHFFGDVIPAQAGTVTPDSDPGQSRNNLSLDSRVPRLRGDGNDKAGRRRDGISDADLLPIIHTALYKENPRMWYSALMDYGALALSDIKNPNKRSRHYAKQSRFEGSRRYARAKILDFLLKKKSGSLKDFQGHFITDTYLHPYLDVLEGLLKALVSEGFLEMKRCRWTLKR